MSRTSISFDGSFDHLHALAEGMIQGELSAAERAELDSLVCGDEAAAQEYALYLLEACRLHQLAKLPQSVSAPIGRLAALAQAIDVRVHPWRCALAVLVIWAGMWLVFGAAVLPWGAQPLAQRPAVAPSESLPTHVARLTATVGARWEDESAAIFEGVFLRRGQVLSLAEGYAKIQFKSGAQVVLTAPARFELTSTNLARMTAGTMTAHVPDRAKGFTVQGTTCVVRDLGTDFGLAIKQGIGEEVHVYTGEVVVQWAGADGGLAKSVRLGAGEAVRIATGAKQVQPLKSVDRRIARELPAPRPDYQWTFDEGVISDAAGQFVSELYGSATVEQGRLVLGRADDFLLIRPADDRPLTWASYTIGVRVKPYGARKQSVFAVTGLPTPRDGISHQLRMLASGAFEHYTYAGAARRGELTVTGQAAANMDRWFHVVITAQTGGSMQLIVDGERQAVWQGPLGAVWQGGRVLRVGQAVGNNPEGAFAGFQGEIDDLAVWRRVLSSAEVRRCYQQATQSIHQEDVRSGSEK